MFILTERGTTVYVKNHNDIWFWFKNKSIFKRLNFFIEALEVVELFQMVFF
jgi:hypothetical protein